MTTRPASPTFDPHPGRHIGRRRHASHSKDLLRLGDLTSDDLARLRHLVSEFRANPGRRDKALEGQTVLCWLGMPAPSVVDNVATAVGRLGGATVLVNPIDMAATRVGTVENAGRVLSRLGALIVLGGLPDHDTVRIATAASTPVLNAFSDFNDPCEALADLVMVEQSGASLAGLKLVYLGRACNVTHDLMDGAALAGMTMVVASPEGSQPDPGVTVRARDLAERHGGQLHLTRRPEDAVVNANAIVLGPKGMPDGRYDLTSALLERADPYAVILNCQPDSTRASSGGCGSHPLSLQQRDNLLLAYQAVIYALTEGLLEGQPGYHP
jgi:ornithine carbamoyltransferase